MDAWANFLVQWLLQEQIWPMAMFKPLSQECCALSVEAGVL